MPSSLLKQLTKFEKIYIIIFFGSVLIGIINGTVDRDYFACCESSIGVPEEGISVMKIFTSNFLLSLTELFTAGMSSLYFNFHTFSVTSSYLISQGALYVVVIILLIGSFELVGSLFMALAGLSFVERRLSKLKPKLDYRMLFFYGTALIFFGAVLEYALLESLL